MQLLSNHRKKGHWSPSPLAVRWRRRVLPAACAGFYEMWCHKLIPSSTSPEATRTHTGVWRSQFSARGGSPGGGGAAPVAGQRRVSSQSIHGKSVGFGSQPSVRSGLALEWQAPQSVGQQVSAAGRQGRWVGQPRCVGPSGRGSQSCAGVCQEPQSIHRLMGAHASSSYSPSSCRQAGRVGK